MTLNDRRQRDALAGMATPTTGNTEQEIRAEIERLSDAIRASQSCDRPFLGDVENERALSAQLADAEARLAGLVK